MKNYVAIIVAVALGAVAMLGFYARMRGIENEKARKSDTIAVVKAKGDIESGETLKSNNVEPASVTIQTARGMNLITWTNKDIYLNMYRLQAKVHKDTLITKDMLLRSSRKSMASELSQGERAITISVDQVSGVAGYIRPGDHVDVYSTFTVPVPARAGERRANVRTYLLLSNVRVLRTGVETNLGKRRSFAARSNAYTSVTLRVREDDAHILAFAQAQGNLTLTLRPPGDPTRPSRKELDMTGLIELLEAPAGTGR